MLIATDTLEANVIDKWALAAVHGVNKAVYTLLATELGMGASQYGGLFPITTSSQQPELNDTGKPYIVYTYTIQGVGHGAQVSRDTVAYSVYGNNEEVRKIVNLVSAYLDRYDVTAADINAFVSANGSDNNKQFDYKSIELISATGAGEPKEEGGPVDALIIFSIQYTHYDETGQSARFH